MSAALPQMQPLSLNMLHGINTPPRPVYPPIRYIAPPPHPDAFPTYPLLAPVIVPPPPKHGPSPPRHPPPANLLPEVHPPVNLVVPSEVPPPATPVVPSEVQPPATPVVHVTLNLGLPFKSMPVQEQSDTVTILNNCPWRKKQRHM